jgi:predicted NBD/HSP70 family sugar kinase
MDETLKRPLPFDTGFLPAAVFNREFRNLLKGSGVPLRFGLEKPDGSVSVFATELFPESSQVAALNPVYAERIFKFLLWQRGGSRIHVGGPPEIARLLQGQYCAGGLREFDFQFMSRLYQRPLAFVSCPAEEVPAAQEQKVLLGRHLDGCRVGFDLGASDRKVSAVIDGRVVYSEEAPWDPRNASDPDYHYRHVIDSIRRAASRLPRLDAVGGSSAGIFIDSRVRNSSLFRGVPGQLFEEKVAGLFRRIQEELGVPLEVINDGDVTALAGSMSLGEDPVLGIAMGSSEAAGYVDRSGSLTGWLNELAFAPIDYRQDAPVDEWSGDAGCGAQYLSQVGAIRVAETAGIRFDPGLGLPDKLVLLQERMRAGDSRARGVYETIGASLGFAVAHYAQFYELRHILVLGRVTTGPGGEALVEQARTVLRDEFPRLSEEISIALPDESNRRVGQAIAAASLPALKQEER